MTVGDFGWRYGCCERLDSRYPDELNGITIDSYIRISGANARLILDISQPPFLVM